jgi:hypothetical protein
LRIPLTQRNDLNRIVKRQKLPKPPHPASIANVIRHSSLAPRLAQIQRWNSALPCSLNLKQITTTRTHKHRFVEFKNSSTFNIDAALDKLGHKQLQHFYFLFRLDSTGKRIAEDSAV